MTQSSFSGRKRLGNNSDRRASKKEAYKKSKSNNSSSKKSFSRKDESRGYSKGPRKEFRRSDERNESRGYSKGPRKEFRRSDERNESRGYNKGPRKEFRRSDNRRESFQNRERLDTPRIKPPKREFYRYESKDEFGVESRPDGFTSYRSRNDERNVPHARHTITDSRHKKPFKKNKYSDKYSEEESSNSSNHRNKYDEEEIEPKKFYKTHCHECGKECEIPFIPKKDDPLFCTQCFKKRKREHRKPLKRKYTGRND